MAVLGRGQTFGATESVTNTKLHNLVDSGTISGITNGDCDASMDLANSKIANIEDSGKVSGSSFFNLTSIPSGAGAIPAANLSAAMPVGAVIPYTGSSAPTGFLICDGSEIAIASYGALYAIIGTTYGSGSGTFKIPDLRGLIPVGLKSTDTAFDTLGETGGASTITLTGAQSGVAAHGHTFPLDGSNDGGTSGRAVNSNGAGADTNGIVANAAAADAAEAHSNLQPYITLNYIIKT